MLRSKYYFALTMAVVIGLPVSFPKVSNAQMGGYAGPYGGYYTIPGSTHVPNLDPKRGGSSSSSGRTYPGEYRFECEERLGIWEWRKRGEKFPFNSPGDQHCEAMIESIKDSCRHLPNP